LYQARKCYKTIDRSSLALALEREMFALEHELFGDCEMSAVFKVLLWKAPRNRIHFTFFGFLIQFDFLKFRGLLLKPNFSQSTPGQTFMNVVCRIHECGWKCKVIGGGGQHGVVHHHVLESKKSLFQMLILKIKSYFDSDD